MRKSNRSKKAFGEKPKAEAGESFEKFRKQYCPDLSRSRLYAVLAIADGRKTVEQDRAKKRESVAKSRAKALSSTSAVGDTPSVATPNGATLETSDFTPKSNIAGNDVDTEASAEARKAVASDTEPLDAAATVEPEPAPAPLAPEEISDDLLSKAKKFWREEIAPGITDDDVKKYRLFISDEKQWKPRARRAARATGKTR